jgi:hypothetical protein
MVLSFKDWSYVNRTFIIMTQGRGEWVWRLSLQHVGYCMACEAHGKNILNPQTWMCRRWTSLKEKKVLWTWHIFSGFWSDILLNNFHLNSPPPPGAVRRGCPLAPPKDPAKIFPQILHPGPQNRSQTIVRTPHRLMAVPKTTINDVLGILNAVN